MQGRVCLAREMKCALQIYVFHPVFLVHCCSPSCSPVRFHWKISLDSYLPRTCLYTQQRNSSSHGYETDVNTHSHNRYGTLFATQYGGRHGHVVVLRQTHNLYMAANRVVVFVIE